MLRQVRLTFNIHGNHAPVAHQIENGREEKGAATIESAHLKQHIRLGVPEQFLIDLQIHRELLNPRAEPMRVLVPGGRGHVVIDSVEALDCARVPIKP